MFFQRILTHTENLPQILDFLFCVLKYPILDDKTFKNFNFEKKSFFIFLVFVLILAYRCSVAADQGRSRARGANRRPSAAWERYSATYRMVQVCPPYAGASYGAFDGSCRADASGYDSVVERRGWIEFGFPDCHMTSVSYGGLL